MEPPASQCSQYPTCRPFCIISGREGSGPKHQNSTTRSTGLKNLVCAFVGYIGSIVPHHYLPIRPPPHAQMMMFGPNCRSKWQKYECGLNIERLRTTFWGTRPGYIGANAIHTTITTDERKSQQNDKSAWKTLRVIICFLKLFLLNAK